MTRRPHSPGFSLFELLIVIGLIAIVSAIAIPRYSGSMENYRASFAARKIAADLALAQNAARATSGARTASFDSAAGVYTINGADNIAAAAGAIRVNLGEPPFSAAFKADFGPGGTQVTFDGYGRPDNPGSVEVKSGRASRIVVLDAQSGACTIQ